MKRHSGLVALSRDHHTGLLFCWKIRQGIAKQIAHERMLSYVRYFWRQHLKVHFEEEERLLFAPFRDELVEQAIKEHGEIRQMIEAVDAVAAVERDQLSALADAVDNHIRFEERVLFPHLEKAISEEKLQSLATMFEQLHADRDKDDYADMFWVK